MRAAGILHALLPNGMRMPWHVVLRPLKSQSCKRVEGSRMSPPAVLRPQKRKCRRPEGRRLLAENMRVAPTLARRPQDSMRWAVAAVLHLQEGSHALPRRWVAPRNDDGQRWAALRSSLTPAA